MKKAFVSSGLLALYVLYSIGAIAEIILPSDAKPLLGDQITQLLDKRSFSFVVYDAGVDARGTSTWDAQNGVVSGEYVWGGDRGKWRKRWQVMGNKNCISDEGKTLWECQNIFVDGLIHYEVRDDGVVHAINTPLAK